MRLEEVAERIAVRNVAGHDRVMSVSAEHGLIEQERFFSKRVASNDLSNYWVLEPGDFVYNKSTSKDAPWGVVARYDGVEPGVVTSLYFAFRAREAVVDPSYLLLTCNGATFFESLRGMLREGARAHGLLNVRLKEFYSAEVPLPPILEQRRIVDLTAAVDAHIEALAREVDSLKMLLASTRLALLTVGPNGNWEGAANLAEAPAEWTKTLPGGWRAETIGAVASVRAGATPLRAEKALYFDGGTIPWVKTGDLNEGVLGDTAERITQAALEGTSVRLLPPDTVLVAMYGGFGQIGRTAMLAVEAATNQAVSALSDLRPDVLPAFVHEALMAGRSKWRSVAVSSRKDPNITKRDIEAFDFPLPPVDQQREITSILGRLRTEIQAACSELSRIRVLRGTLLASLLKQEIEIPNSYDALVERAS